LLDLRVEFLLPATIEEQNRTDNAVNTWLSSLPSPTAPTALDILASTASSALSPTIRPAVTNQGYETLDQAPEAYRSSLISDATLSDPEQHATNN